ncbi:MAG: hypothetical protein ACOX3T_02570 [Bdellovibrionota bacterium]
MCAIKTNGELWCWGDNYYNILALTKDSKISLPIKIFDNVKQLEFSREQFHIITNSGELYRKGNNMYKNKEALSFKKVLDNVSKILTTFDATYALTNDGKLYHCYGLNHFKLREQSVYASNLREPLLVYSGVKDVIISPFGLYIVDASDNLYGYGPIFYFRNISVLSKLRDAVGIVSYAILYYLAYFFHAISKIFDFFF